MATSQHFICVVTIISSLSGVHGCNGYYTVSADQCRFSSWDLSDLEYIRSYWFNKAEYIRFNSTVGKYVGYTEFGVHNAEQWNKQPGELERMRAEKDRYCRPNAQNDINYILTKTVQPVVTLRLEKASIGEQPAVLVCSAYDFYPKMIKLTWHRDGQEVTGDVVFSEELADGDWYYQVHSHLVVIPKAGEKISCVVEHASLKEPLEIVWDPSMTRLERTKFAIGAAGLVLGFIVMIAGFVYYKRKCKVQVSVPKKSTVWSLDMGPAHKTMKNALWLLNSVTMSCDKTPMKSPVKQLGHE